MYTMAKASSPRRSLDPYSVCLTTYNQLNKGWWCVPLARIPLPLQRSTPRRPHRERRIILPAHAILETQEEQLYSGRWSVTLFSEEVEKLQRECRKVKRPAGKTRKLRAHKSTTENESRDKGRRKRQQTVRWHVSESNTANGICDEEQNNRQAVRRPVSQSDTGRESCDRERNQNQQTVRRNVNGSCVRERSKKQQTERLLISECDTGNVSSGNKHNKKRKIACFVRRPVTESDTEDEGSDEEPNKKQQAIRRPVSESNAENESYEEKRNKRQQAVRRSISESGMEDVSGDKERKNKRQAVRRRLLESDTQYESCDEECNKSTQAECESDKENENCGEDRKKKRLTVRQRKYERDPENEGCDEDGTKKRSPPKVGKGNFEYFAERIAPQIMQNNPGFTKKDAVGQAFLMWEDMDELDRSLHVPRIAVGSDYAKFEIQSTKKPARR